jgi:hypothetical protein
VWCAARQLAKRKRKRSKRMRASRREVVGRGGRGIYNRGTRGPAATRGALDEAFRAVDDAAAVSGCGGLGLGGCFVRKVWISRGIAAVT